MRRHSRLEIPVSPVALLTLHAWKEVEHGIVLLHHSRVLNFRGKATSYRSQGKRQVSLFQPQQHLSSRPEAVLTVPVTEEIAEHLSPNPPKEGVGSAS